jgi:hypothetical protein
MVVTGEEANKSIRRTPANFCGEEARLLWERPKHSRFSEARAREGRLAFHWQMQLEKSTLHYAT